MNSSERFTAILKKIQETHDKKGADYGTDKDGLANIRQASEFGVEPWVGAILRVNDKMMRLKTFIKKGKLVNESVEDSLLDLAVYTIIALTLYPDKTDTIIMDGPYEDGIIPEDDYQLLMCGSHGIWTNRYSGCYACKRDG